MLKPLIVTIKIVTTFKTKKLKYPEYLRNMFRKLKYQKSNYPFLIVYPLCLQLFGTIRRVKLKTFWTQDILET